MSDVTKTTMYSDPMFNFTNILSGYDNNAIYITNMLFNSSLQPVLEEINMSDHYNNGWLYYIYNESAIQINMHEHSTRVGLTVIIYNNEKLIVRYDVYLDLNNVKHLNLIARYIEKVKNAYEYTERQIEDILTTMWHKTYEDTILNEY